MLVVALVAAWAVVLRPQALGGPAAYVLVSGTSMLPGLKDGDLVLVRRAPSYGVGDVVAYRVPQGDPAAGLQVIHRITGGTPAGYEVQGDNRDLPDLWHPAEGDVVGKSWLRIPYGGRLLAFVQQPFLLAGAAAAIAVGSVVGRPRPTAARAGAPAAPTAPAPAAPGPAATAVPEPDRPRRRRRAALTVGGLCLAALLLARRRR